MNATSSRHETPSIQQVFGLLSVSLGSLLERRGAALMILASAAGAVAVLTSMLAMVQGLLAVAANTGRMDRAIVTSADATAELRSSLSAETVARVLSMPGIVKLPSGQVLASVEAVALAEITAGTGRRAARLPLRGLSSTGFAVRSELQIVEGRRPQSGLRELLVGRMAAAQEASLRVGNRIRMRDADWLVVGMFASGGSLHESELITDVDTLRAAYHRSQYQSVIVQLESAAAFADFRQHLEVDGAISVSATPEVEYYSRQAQGVRRVLTFVAYFVGGAMALGGTLAAINAMYTTVRRRSVEIATLRAIGFSAGGILGSVLLEAVLLAAAGGLLGVVLALLFVDGTVASTVRDGSSQLLFTLIVTPAIASTGFLWACGMGFLGGLLPAWRAVRIPAAIALRMA